MDELTVEVESSKVNSDFICFWISISLIMNVTFRQLRVFVEVVRHGSVLRAAEALHLTPPAVSMQIKEVESQVGLPLFDRAGRRLSLSTAGDRKCRRVRAGPPAAHPVARPPENGGTVCALVHCNRRRVAGPLPDTRRNPSGNRQWPACGNAGGIGSLALYVGMSSRASWRIGGQLGCRRQRRKCLQPKVSLLECR